MVKALKSNITQLERSFLRQMATDQPLEAQVLEEFLFESFEFRVAHLLHYSNVLRDRRAAKHDLLEMRVRLLVRLRFQTVFECTNFVLQHIIEELFLFMDIDVLDLREDLGQVLFHFVIIGNVAEV